MESLGESKLSRWPSGGEHSVYENDLFYNLLWTSTGFSNHWWETE